MNQVTRLNIKDDGTFTGDINSGEFLFSGKLENHKLVEFGVSWFDGYNFHDIEDKSITSLVLSHLI